MKTGIAAGHPATAAAGAEILEAGGTAADAAVAASLASCVAETVMTGFLGGGHAVYFDAASGETWNLDCFCAVPGIGREPRPAELVELQVPFGDESIHYSIGPASCAVPGLPAGLDALWQRYGRLPWPELCTPALRLAREGVAMPPAHAACLAMLEPAMTMNEGARIYSPGGRLLQAGGRLEQPGLVRTLELVAEEGALSVYRGSIAQILLDLMDERGGLVTGDDLGEYRARWLEPCSCGYLHSKALTRRGLHPVSSAFARLGVPEVVVTLGARGSLVYAGGRTEEVPARPVAEDVDPTGAGDAFAGGLLGHLARAGTLDDRTLCRAVLHGAVCASFAVEQFSVDGIERADLGAVERRVGELEALVTT
jgi:gamma-glutamyltranspeptidase/glutathione hydrolase